MQNASFNWQEVCEPGSIERTNLTATNASFAKQLDIYIRWQDVERCIEHVLGYAKISEFQPALNIVTKQWQLNRRNPARHPKFPWLRATRVMAIQGRGGRKLPRTWTRVQSGQGWYASWNRAKVSILFEAPPYPILDDNQTFAEYQRYTLKSFDGSTENIARRGERWKFLHADATAITNDFAGDQLVRQPKGMLHWEWFNVPEDWVLLGKLKPTNLDNAVGKVNQYSFPAFADFDRNPIAANNLVKYQPGTLLMLPYRMTPRSQIHPSIVSGPNALTASYPRTFDVSLSMLVFDPPTNDNTRVALNDADGIEYDTTVIRGHNLVPLPQTTNNGYRWFAACRNRINVVAGLVNNARDLLYEYYDYENVFSYARTE